MTRKIKRIRGVKSRMRKGLMASVAHIEADRLERNDLTSLHGSVLKRVQGAVNELVKLSPKAHLYEALSTNTSMDALIHLVSSDTAAAQVALNVADPLRAARARAAKQMSELLAAEGGPIRVEDAAERLRITRAAVDKRRRTGTLIGIEDGGRAVLYPGWQFTKTGLLPGVDEVLRAMVVSDPWMRIQFFLRADPDLGERPLDSLRRGRKQDVIVAAERYGRHGDDG
ncbi:MAG TPA: hypothetical protein VFO63_12665 [Blastocatellia bacterium]|nr:hypothetical protein [Blastocatellia bacterium]